MGKSQKGAVWLNEEMYSAYNYFQFWRNIDDEDVLRFANLYSEFSEEEMKRFESLVQKNINTVTLFRCIPVL